MSGRNFYSMAKWEIGFAIENVEAVPAYRLGYNVGYLKFTAAPAWNPF